VARTTGFQSVNTGSIPVGATMKNYLEISRAFDLENKRERVLYRFFEILPGFLSWSTLFLAVFLSYFSPVLIAVFHV
jgi:hypothetical protein